jgi:hypothetical protein
MSATRDPNSEFLKSIIIPSVLALLVGAAFHYQGFSGQAYLALFTGWVAAMLQALVLRKKGR